MPLSEVQRREARLRRELYRRGFLLRKSRCRIPEVPGYGGYMVVNAQYNAVVTGGSPWAYSLSLEEVADWLESI